ncbi:MAG: DUF3124 domain-containing protein [Weeksellaceae bacterium]
MRKLIFFGFVIFCILLGCQAFEQENSTSKKQQLIDRKTHNDWEKRQIHLDQKSNLYFGNTYLAVYSEIYARKESRTYPLTITVSIRNTSLNDSVYINKSEYYNTQGDLINTYFDNSIYLAPMETVEIVVEEDHEQGGSGGNFVFHWATKSKKIKPLFEAIMISASGQQGISFTTQGIDLE